MGLESIESAFNEAPAVEPAPEVIAEPAVEVVTPEPVVETPAEPVIEAPKEEQRTVPLPTFLDQRDELKAERKRREEAEARLNEREAPKAPDPFDSPEEFAQFTDQKLQSALIGQRFQMSELMAKQAHGADTVDAAAKWAEEKAKADPTFAASYMREMHPIDWIVRQHKRDGLISQLPDDVASLDELIEKRIAERGLIAPGAVMVAPSEQPHAPKVTPARSLASQPSVHGGVKDIPTGPMASLRSVFG